MKTICGKLTSTKQISLSKAAKIFSKFVSAENGASHVNSVYLHRAFNSFSELKQLHKELKLPRSDRKHKRNRSESHDDRENIEENSIRSLEINQELNQEYAHSENKFRKYQFGGENNGEDEEKPSQTVVKFSEEPNNAIEYHAGNEGGSERHKKKNKKRDIDFQGQGGNAVEIGEREGERKPLTEAVTKNEEKTTQGVSQQPTESEKHKKKKKHEVESKKHRTNDIEFEEGSNEVKVSSKAQESLVQSVEARRELDDIGHDNKEMEERKKHKREKKKMRNKDGMNNFSRNKGKVIEPEDESFKKMEDQNEISNNVLEGENGSLNDHQELQNNKKERYEAGSKDKIDTDEVKRVQKKRKNEDAEGRVEDRSGQPTKKIKRKHGRDD